LREHFLHTSIVDGGKGCFARPPWGFSTHKLNANLKKARWLPLGPCCRWSSTRAAIMAVLTCATIGNKSPVWGQRASFFRFTENWCLTARL